MAGRLVEVLLAVAETVRHVGVDDVVEVAVVRTDEAPVVARLAGVAALAVARGAEHRGW